MCRSLSFAGRSIARAPLPVTTAVPKIITDFQDITGISWISTAYLVTTTYVAQPLRPSNQYEAWSSFGPYPYVIQYSALIPIYGKLGTIFGRRSTYLTAIFLFELGSLLCGVATSMTMLILGRAVAGLGVGGLFISVIVMISSMVSQRDNAKYMR